MRDGSRLDLTIPLLVSKVNVGMAESEHDIGRLTYRFVSPTILLNA